MAITIRTEQLVKKYGTRTVVNHVSFDVKQGEIVGLLGPNGAGKTTSFYQVVGLVKPDEGKVFLNDLDITALPMYKRAQMGIGYLPQEASVFRKMTVEENIQAVLELQIGDDGRPLDRPTIERRLDMLLKDLQIEAIRSNAAMSLSGGGAITSRNGMRRSAPPCALGKSPAIAMRAPRIGRREPERESSPANS